MAHRIHHLMAAARRIRARALPEAGARPRRRQPRELDLRAREWGKGKKAATEKITSWSMRADVVRELDRGEREPEAAASGSTASDEAAERARFQRTD